jgi:NAD(P)-dependent dehydrogenase (short-subunit alcohol dehydrogenase family)
MRVALLDVFAEKLHDAAASVGAKGFVCDVTDPASCAKAVVDIEVEWAGVRRSPLAAIRLRLASQILHMFLSVCLSLPHSLAVLHPSQAAISFLFNNAGINDQKSKVLTSTPEDWQTTFSVNVFGAVNILQAFTPGMLERALPSGRPSRLVTIAILGRRVIKCRPQSNRAQIYIIL